MTWRNPTIEDVREVAESIRLRSNLVGKACELRDRYFSERFFTLPPGLRDQFMSTREEYFTSLQADQTLDPWLNKYYRRAARRFHPDSVGNDSKRPLFQSAREAYIRGDLQSLQALVLEDYAQNIDGLPQPDREFLISEFPVLERVADTIWEQAAKSALAAAEIQGMSDTMFQLEIHEAIAHMQKELHRRGAPESPQRPSLLEGR